MATHIEYIQPNGTHDFATVLDGHTVDEWINATRGIYTFVRSWTDATPPPVDPSPLPPNNYPPNPPPDPWIEPPPPAPESFPWWVWAAGFWFLSKL